jgi:putative FmdB family regulatory protein
MPIYEYACDTCGETLEVIQSVSAPPPDAHEACGGRLRRVLSAPTTRVKAPGGETSTTHTSMLRFQDNQKIAADKKKRQNR